MYVPSVSHLSGKPSLGFWAKFHVDFPLLCGLFVLLALGLGILYSASHQSVDSVLKQLFHIGVGLCVMFVIAQFSPQALYRLSIWIYVLGLVLLLAVLLVGDVGKGAQRWLQFGGFRFQPSELMKLALPLMVARFFHDKTSPPKLYTLAIAVTLIAFPTLMIAKQPDLGTSLLIASSGFFVLLFSGISWRLVALAGFLVSLCAPFLWFSLHSYQKQRILTFLNPESDPLGAGWNIIQSKIAIGSGGFSGKGWFQGSQSQLNFLPESSTDFIFAVLCEEFGLVGVLVLMCVYLFIIFRGLHISVKAQDTFSRLLTVSLTLTFFVYIFVNVGMVSGLLPVVGLPLPLVSYGGTSIVSLLMSFGILMSVHTHRKLLPS